MHTVPDLNSGKLLAITMILLSASASVGYLYQRDYRRALYWAASAILIGSVTF